MSSFDCLSDFESCNGLVKLLLERDNRDLVVYYHEIGPITSLRYKGYHFYLKYNRDHFARLEKTQCFDNNKEILFEFASLISEIIGNPIAYYEMHFVEDGQNKVNPTIEWCLDKEKEDEYVNNIINNRLFDDGGKCLDVKIFDFQETVDSQNKPQVLLKK